MADDTFEDEEGGTNEENDDFGALTGDDDSLDDSAGNLPPLSDFESTVDNAFDSSGSLPPLGSLDLDSGPQSSGGLPPIEDLAVEEPVPTGGSIKPTPPGIEEASSGSDGGSEFDPSGTELDVESPVESEGSGFQDLTADSHFPQAESFGGPGPDSDLDTPMFDSAFGGPDVSLGDSGVGAHDTPAEEATQRMDTPVFGADDSGGDMMGADDSGGFEDDAFDLSGGFGVDESSAGGTPMPDFSPDTGMQPDTGPLTSEDLGEGPKKKRRRAGSPLAMVITGLVAVLIGIAAGPTVDSIVKILPNKARTDLGEAQKTIEARDKRIKELEGEITGGEFIPQEEIDARRKELKDLQDGIAALALQAEEAEAERLSKEEQLGSVALDLEASSESYIEAQEAYEELLNETAIVKARHLGLLAEVDRLTERVGDLEEANARRLASKEALEHDIERLEVVVREGIPLTPEKYARVARLEAVQDLKAKAQAAKWVTPALIDAYTMLYQREMSIAQSKEYFFARIPVVDKIGSTHQKWAECLMIGNWGVYYRTLDGANIGVYEKRSTSEMAQYEFYENPDSNVGKAIEAQIIDARVDGFDAKLEVLAKKQEIMKGSSDLQRIFDSL